MKTTTHNIKTEPEVINDPLYTYCGRGSKCGNPFRIGPDGTREEVIHKFRKYGEVSGFREYAKQHLKGRKLGCYCKPLDCHTDVLAEWADQ